MSLFVSAGEASGDHHAAAVIRALRRSQPEWKIVGICGPEMMAAGANSIVDLEELNVMGLTDVFKAFQRIRSVERRVMHHVKTHPPKAALLVDFPGFHMRIGRKLRRMGIPVIQYIAPKLWAWGKWRVALLRKAQDRLACILPFEPTWFARYGIQAQYVGNPSAVECASGWSREELNRRLHLRDDAPLVALLPGSRPQELSEHVDLMVEVWKELKRRIPLLQGVVIRAPTVNTGALDVFRRFGVHVLDRQQVGFAMPADAALAVSGTATLELALWQVPTVLIYRGNPWTVHLARRLISIPYIGLVNILLQEEVMPELIQEKATKDNILAHLLPLLATREGDRQRRAFLRLTSLLGRKDPAKEVVEMIERFHS